MIKVESKFMIGTDPVVLEGAHGDIKVYVSEDGTSAYVVKSDLVLFRLDTSMSQETGFISNVEKLVNESKK